MLAHGQWLKGNEGNEIFASGQTGFEVVKSVADGAEKRRVLDYFSWRSWLMPTSSSAEPSIVTFL